jgi:nitric oxide reductase large subunit
MRRFAIGLGCALAAWVIGAFAGGFLISLASSNAHDRSLEAAMTGAFVIGPIAAIIGFMAGFSLSARAPRGPHDTPPPA